MIFLGEKASQGEQGTLLLGIAGDRPRGGALGRGERCTFSMVGQP